MTKRIQESASIVIDPTTKRFRVCLISEGSGSSADFERSFFVAENAERLKGALSFPGHPFDIDHPEHRDPLSAIASIGDEITIEEHNGKMGFWGEYIPAQSRPDVASYLMEYGTKLGLSIYSDSEGHESASGKWVAEALTADDPYRSVDLVVAAGAGGKFDRVAEALRLITEASATAEEKKETPMDIKEVEGVVAAAIAPLSKVVEGLVTALEGKATAELQAKVDESAVNKAVESRLGDYDKAVDLITEAKLTESQSASLRALAITGVDITPHIETAKQVLAEAKAIANGTGKIVENHIAGSGPAGAMTYDVPGFGKVVG